MGGTEPEGLILPVAIPLPFRCHSAAVQPPFSCCSVVVPLLFRSKFPPPAIPQPFPCHVLRAGPSAFCIFGNNCKRPRSSLRCGGRLPFGAAPRIKKTAFEKSACYALCEFFKCRGIILRLACYSRRQSTGLLRAAFAASPTTVSTAVSKAAMPTAA